MQSVWRVFQVSDLMLSIKWRKPIKVIFQRRSSIRLRYSMASSPTAHASFVPHGHKTVSATEALLFRVHVCGTVCYRTYDTTDNLVQAPERWSPADMQYDRNRGDTDISSAQESKIDINTHFTFGLVLLSTETLHILTGRKE